MAKNRFTVRDKTDEKVEYSLDEMLIDVMRQEFPDDTIFQSGKLTASETTKTSFVSVNGANGNQIELEVRNGSNVLTISSGSSKYVEYKIDKTFPAASENDLDEILDEEWNYFVREGTLRATTETGLFLINAEIELNPVDFHYEYIARGPHQIESRLTREDDLNEVVRTTFCVFYIENGIALPIPNYQTLEVMLVERGLTYDAIREATAEQLAQFDMVLDGSFIGDRTANKPENPYEEFQFRQVLDRSRDWNYRVRFDSGYRPREPFYRDPGDYLKPPGYAGTTGTSDLYTSLDPEDLLFDLAFQKQTYLEKLREKYEGKMIVGLWPVGTDVYDQNFVDGFTSNVISDGLTYQVRMMINGFWKQVIDDQVFRLYASINNIDLSLLASRPNSPYTNFIEDSPDGGDYISGERGFINLLVQAGGIDALQGFSTVWGDFPHIVEADRLDIAEYKEYIDNYSNSNNAFDIDYLKPYEPAGSTAFYPLARILVLQEQVRTQAEIESLRASIQELWPRLAANVAKLDTIAKSLPANYQILFEQRFGNSSPLFKIITADSPYKYVKKKRGDLKEKDSQYNLLTIYENNTRVSAGAFSDDSDADRIVNISNWGRSRGNGNPNVYALPRDLSGARIRSLVKSSDYVRDTIRAELFSILTTLDLAAKSSTGALPAAVATIVENLPAFIATIVGNVQNPIVLSAGSRVVAADNLIVDLREAVNEASEFVIEIDSLIVNAESIAVFQDIYTRIVTLNTVLDSFNDDGLAFCDQVRIDIERVFKEHLDRLYRAVQYFRQRVHDEIGNRSKFGVKWSSNARSIIEQYLPGKSFENYLPSLE